MLAAGVQLPSISEKSTLFSKKHVFFTKHSFGCLVGAGRSGSFSCCHFLCALSPRGFTFVSYTLFHFLVLSRCSLLRRDPRTSFLALFSEGFSDPRVYRYPMYLCSEVFFLQRQKSVFKSSYRVRGMGPPQGPAFACTVTILNKTKKQKLKKTQVLFGILISNKHFGALCDLCFFSFCSVVLFSMVTVHAKAGPGGGPIPLTL